MAQRIAIFLVLFMDIQRISSYSCPDPCTCTELTAICRGVGWIQLPAFKMSPIQFLAVNQNPIRTIQDKAFQRLEDLDALDLSVNKVANVSSKAFFGLISLRKLILARNHIQTLPENVFSPLMQLEHLDLSYNQIRYIPFSLERLIYLKSIKLAMNPLHCPCELTYFAQSLIYMELSSFRAKCQSPEKLMNRYLSDLTMDNCMQENSSMSTNGSIAAKISERPESVRTTLGDKIVLSCRAMGHPPPRITWVLPTNITRFVRYFSRNQVIKIIEMHDYYSGLYTCIAKNSAGMDQVSASVAIVDQQRAHITVKPLDQEVEEGETVVLRCHAEGRPTPKITWIWYRSTPMQLSSSLKCTIRAGMLILRKVKESDGEGRYVCYASNAAGSARVSAVLRVLPKRNNTEESKPMPNPIQSEKFLLDQDSLLKQVISKARRKVEEAIQKTADRLRDPKRRRTISDIQTLFRQPNQAAIELGKAAQVYEAAIDEITNILRQRQILINFTHGAAPPTFQLHIEQLAIVSQLSGCQQPIEESQCAQQLCFHLKYRSIDGYCNNFNQPRLGAALSPFRRLLSPEYENSVNTPIGWSPERLYYGFPKPSARYVSTELLSAKNVTQDNYNSAMLMQWGQFLDHDLDFTPVDASSSRFSDGLSCNETCHNDAPCFPILVPPGDPRINRRCVGFTRSSATCGSGTTSILLGKPHFREQINQITSFIDASNVYGSDAFEASQLRDTIYDEGMLRVGMPTLSGKRLMPFSIRGMTDCQTDPLKNFVSCFQAGDHRSNENLGLLVMHTIWVREHNRIASELKVLNPHWTGDKLFHESRKIVGAIMQAITYNEWLPHVLGEEGMQMLGSYYRYDDKVNPTISNEFATAAFRFGHTLINPILYRFDEKFQEIPQGHLPLHKAFFAPDMILQDGGMDPILRGLLHTGTKLVTPHQPMNTELTEKLFSMAHEVAQDLASLNIQRGRDHGIPNYNSFRRFCGLPVAETFDDLSTEIPSPEIRERLRRVYGHPGNIDLFAGAILETVSPGAKMGPTFRCIIIDQFRRLRDGDRFYYENQDTFTSVQQAQIRRANLARVICDNGDNITHIQQHAFVRAQSTEDYIPCEKIEQINLIAWKECLGYTPQPEEQVPNAPSRRRRRDVSSKSQFNRIEELTGTVRKLQADVEELKMKFRGKH